MKDANNGEEPIVYREATIRYISKLNKDTSGDVFPEYSTIKVGLSNVKVYYDAMPILVNTSTCGRNLIDFLAREMDSKGIIINSEYIRSEFRKRITKYSNGKINYTDGTVNVAFSELSKNELLISKGKGIYKVNPLYHYRNSAKNRIHSIKMELNSKIDKNNGNV